MMTDAEYDKLIADEKAAREQRQRDSSAAAKACLNRWGEFTVQKKWLASLSVLPPEQLFSGHIDQINKLIGETELKARQRLFVMRKAPPATECLDWTDERVAQSVFYLTELDYDRARARNFSGWSKSDSSNGHMIYAVLRSGDPDDHPAVLNAARSMLTKYGRQLSMMPTRRAA